MYTFSDSLQQHSTTYTSGKWGVYFILMNINCTQLNTIYVYREQQVLSRLYVLCDKLIENNELTCRMRTFCHMSTML